MSDIKTKSQKNDQRSNNKNPNNPSYKASTYNRSNQLNPNNPEYKRDKDE